MFQVIPVFINLFAVFFLFVCFLLTCKYRFAHKFAFWNYKQLSHINTHLLIIEEYLDFSQTMRYLVKALETT